MTASSAKLIASLVPHPALTLTAFTLLAATVLGTVAPVTATPAFDGNWSVLIVTEKGQCDRGYRYPVLISNGNVRYAGDASFAVSGRVGDNGAITVTVSHGEQSARGTGRLSGNSGTGAWKAGECSGRWTAERRR